MASSDTCGVCIEKYNGTIARKKISCGYCDYHSCVTCTQKYLLTQIVDAHCMGCRTGWNREFLDINMTKSFRTGPWRENKKIMILNREKALLPTMQRYAASKKRMEELSAIMTLQTKEMTDIYKEMNKVETDLSLVRSALVTRQLTNEEEASYLNQLDEILEKRNIHKNIHYKHDIKQSKVHNEFANQSEIYHDTGSKVKEKKEFILKCVKEGCRGFLSSSYKCELCSTFVCKDCMVIKSEKNDDTHVCKKEDVDTVTMIRKDTRPCPKCGIRISKIDGCDMMWCVADGCGTAFSWNNGTIMSGVIHNPHYYEWVRRNNNSVVPANPNQGVACGQNVNYVELYRILNISYVIAKDRLNISTIHRSLLDIEHARVPSYPQTRDINMFKELHCDFLLNRIQEDAWKQSMFLKENNFEKKQQIGLVLRTYVTVCNDNFNKFYQEMLLKYNEYNRMNKTSPTYNEESIKFQQNIKKIISEFIKECNALRLYINDSLVKTGTVMMCAVPQIDKEWNWQTIRKVDNILEENRIAALPSPLVTPS